MTLTKKFGFACTTIVFAFVLLLMASSQTAWALEVVSDTGTGTDDSELNADVSAAGDAFSVDSEDVSEGSPAVGMSGEENNGGVVVGESVDGQSIQQGDVVPQEATGDGVTLVGEKDAVDALAASPNEFATEAGESVSETPAPEDGQQGAFEEEAPGSKTTMMRTAVSATRGLSNSSPDAVLDGIELASEVEMGNASAPALASSPTMASAGTTAAPAKATAAVTTKTTAAASTKTTVKAASATAVAAKNKNDTSAPVAHVLYRTHVQNDGWQNYKKDGAMSGTQGRALRLEGINIYLVDENGKKVSGNKGGIQYQVHVQNIGWQDAKANDAMAGTTGKAYRLEAIRIMVTGELSQYYDIAYRTHVQNEGWQGWKRNGVMAGTEGKGYRLEGIEIKLEKKATKQSTGADGIVGVRYRGHVQDVGWQAYVIDGDIAGTSGRSLRVEALNIALDKGIYSGGIEYQSHVQNVGWQGWKSNGAMTGTSGKSLRVEALRIRLTGDIAKS
ncbi:MAG: Ig domain-containing protein, partial [Eggerthellaceae bacterium]|nr:Ig domain-containing protein [Eggerthellaceae bacterium]